MNGTKIIYLRRKLIAAGAFALLGAGMTVLMEFITRPL